MQRFCLVILLCMHGVALADSATPAQMTATVDHGSLSPGDTLRYTLEIEHNPEVSVQVDEPSEQLGGLVLVDQGHDPERVVGPGGRLRERRWYSLRADSAGAYALRSPQASYRSQTGALVPLAAQEVLVQVGGAAPGELADIKPINQVAYWPRWLWVAGGAVVLALLAAAVWWWLKHRKRNAALPPMQAHEVAFAALDRLRRTNFEDDEAVRRYYFALSEVLRNYVEARFRINATDLTSEELLARLPTLVGLADAQQLILRRFMNLTDPVKYANETPGGPEIAQCYELALSFVEATRVRAAVEAA